MTSAIPTLPRSCLALPGLAHLQPILHDLNETAQWPWSGTTNERWEPEAAGVGYYRFKSVGSGKCLNVKGGGVADCTQVIQYTCVTDGAPNDVWLPVWETPIN
ncbi:RICIN domain-containing protein [Streptomyces chryseus]|uniref:RICIN domain-containing protein n=1 Tax=Streptomyces chryseus TaxID=68186 RepID=UPI001991F6C3|nr:RICIN domain-containing protein [Streptomyces chryseus]GGX43956.1 hypothetical protein GCM10010353_68670 [Streptomyces chryseus]